MNPEKYLIYDLNKVSSPTQQQNNQQPLLCSTQVVLYLKTTYFPILHNTRKIILTALKKIKKSFYFFCLRNRK